MLKALKVGSRVEFHYETTSKKNSSYNISGAYGAKVLKVTNTEVTVGYGSKVATVDRKTLKRVIKSKKNPEYSTLTWLEG